MSVGYLQLPPLHGSLKAFIWVLHSGTKAYDKLSSILTSKQLRDDIKKLSSDTQTSCLEGFHATLNHWHPKMIHFSWLGTFCRLAYNTTNLFPYIGLLCYFVLGSYSFFVMCI